MLIQNALVYNGRGLEEKDVRIESGVFSEIEERLAKKSGEQAIDAQGKVLSPGFIDLHVHLREPGFEYKETIATGSAAAAKGGFTTVCAMPNLKPFPDNAEELKKAHKRIKETAAVRVLPYGCITKGENGETLAPLEEMAELCCAFSDDGKGVQSEKLMAAAMALAAKTKKPIAAHCEVESMLNGGYIHAGPYAALHGHKGIVSESETAEVKRNIRLAEVTGAHMHICHVSAKESIAAIALGKKAGVKVTCEVTPHQVLLCEDDIAEDHGRFKMNPPLREEADRAAIQAALLDGTVDAIATDHAPHSEEEKAKGLAGSNMGVVGLETAFGVLNAGLVNTGILKLERLLHLLTFGPAAVFGLSCGIVVGTAADCTLLDIKTPWQVKGEGFISMGKSTPFEGYMALGKPVLTLVGGKVAFCE